MSKSIIEPAGDHVLVVDLPRSTVIADIELPDNERQKEMCYGTVVFIGPLVSPYTKPEDVVLYGPYAGKNVVLNGIEFRLLREGQLEGYIRKTQ